ncbi:olfactory receptor 18-like [Sorex araneus]|uniref:olfactory receptor 18-like n=1 Tax=Sorex araneus TaxID=42254 RepID=UPI0024339F74|nr:olfactory receptor 18-like [Sorex araneus]
MLAISSDARFHTPTYFFLSVLSTADIGFTSTTVPNMVWDIHTQSRNISHAGCLVQLSLYVHFECLECIILGVMAYDRFVAICHPLHHQIIMNPGLCGRLLLGSICISLLDSQLYSLMMSQLIFCSQVWKSITSFVTPPQLLSLASGDIFTDNLIIYFIVAIVGGFPVSGIFNSYTKIVFSVLRISSKAGMSKAFCTSGSHLSVVGLFYGTAMGVYLSLADSHSPPKQAVASVMYTMVVPMLNPFIYSLRNQDIKRVFQKFLSRTFSLNCYVYN